MANNPITADRKEYFRQYQRERYARKREEILNQQKIAYQMKKKAGTLPVRPDRTEYLRQLNKNRPTNLKMFRRVRLRAEKGSIPFNLELDDIEIPTHCPILGIELSVNTENAWACDASPSLDRLRPELGYVKGNVNVISYRANRIKNNATLDELRAVTTWLEKKLAE